jgi:hypothetical protein
MDSALQERRRANRLQMAVPVVLHTAAGDLLAESRNISNEGMFVRSPVFLPIGAKIQMTFSVPSQHISHEDVRVHCGGRVARLEPMEDGFGIAIAWQGRSVCAAG